MQQCLGRWTHGFRQAVSRKDSIANTALDLRIRALSKSGHFLAGLLLLASCSPDSGTTTSPSLQTWLDTVPLLTLGSVEGDGPEGFTSIQAVALSPDGSLAVTEHSPLEIRVFDSLGQHRLTIGRDGEGPGEFVGAPKIRFLGPDTLLAWDPGQFRLTWFSMDGRVIRELPLGAQVNESSSGQNFITGWWDLLPDGSVLAPDWINTRSLYVLGINPPSVQRIASLHGYRFPMVRGIEVGNYELLTPFRTSTAYAAGGDGTIWVSDSTRWTVSAFSLDSSLKGEFHIGKQRTPVTPDLMDAALKSMQADLPKIKPGLLEAAFNQLDHPDSVSAIQSLFWEAPGFLWVRHHVGMQQPSADY